MKYSYPVAAFIVGLLVYIAGYAIKAKFGDAYYATELPWLIIFFEVSSILIHFLMTKKGNENPKRFPAKFMAIQGLKMFIYMVVLVGYSLTLMEQALPFVASFGLLYILFSILEAHFILKNISASKA